MNKILLIPKLINETGGPGSFQKRLIEGFIQRKVKYTFDLRDNEIDSVLLINGTRNFLKLLRFKLKGIPIVHRLGSPATLKSYLQEPMFSKFKHYCIQKYLAFIRRYIANSVIYQSEFVKNLWDKKHGAVKAASKVIYNGTDFDFFSPQKNKYVSSKKYTIISVEGTQGNDPFDIILKLGKELNKRRDDFEILMIGKSSGNIQEKIKKYNYINFIGEVTQKELPYYYSVGNLYLLTDIIQAGCPNSAIEAMACGLPVVSYNIGPITELIHDKYSRLINIENDPWLGLNPGNIDIMANEIENIFQNYNIINSSEIRNLSKKRYSFELMSNEYLSILKNK